MKSKKTVSSGAIVLGILGIVCFVAGGLAKLEGLSNEVYYTLLFLALALLIGAVVEVRLDVLNGKLDELLRKQSS